MIEAIAIDGVRNVKGQIALTPKTLIIGRNGSGKSAYRVGGSFAALGYVPGYQIRENAANVGNGEMSALVAYDDGKSIARRLSLGKTVSERVAVNGGAWQQRNAAAGMIEVAFGTEPRIMDVAAFWAGPPAEQRRAILRLSGNDDCDALIAAEATARKALNTARQNRQAAEKVVERLTLQLADIERPAGNLAALRKELAEARTTAGELETKVATGKANDRARAGHEKAKKDIPGLVFAAELAAKEHAEATEAWQLRRDEFTAIEAKKPEVEPYEIPEDARLAIFDCAGGLATWKPTIEAAKLVKTRALAILQPVMKRIEDSEFATSQMRTWRELHEHALEKGVAAKNAKEDAERKADKAADALSIGRNAVALADAIGPGLDPDDETALAGLRARIARIEADIIPHERIDAINQQIESAKIDVEKSVGVEDKTKEELTAATTRQAEAVETADLELTERSKLVLPYGHLRMSATDKDVTISWQMDDKRNVQRAALSGGEQAVFDAALGYAMAPGATIFLEGAEMDDQRLRDTMTHLNGCPAQVVLLTCHGDGLQVDGWSVVDLG